MAGDDSETALRYRNYAEELRIIAADKTTPENRRVLQNIADGYDRLADSLEAMAQSKGTMGMARSAGG